MNATADATCPVCNGSARIPAGNTAYKTIMASYDAGTDTFSCRNCGGQTMGGHGTGRVRVRPDGMPCTHKYEGQQKGHCYWEYVCMNGCGDRYCIDSGD